MQTATASRQTGPASDTGPRFVAFDQTAWRDTGRTAAKADLLVEQELADRASRQTAAPDRPRRRWFGLRRADRPAATPVRTVPASPDRSPRPRRDGGLGYRVQEFVGYIPMIAALTVAGVYQTDMAHDVLKWDYAFAWIVSAAIEGGVARYAIRYERHLVAGDSTFGVRAKLWGFTALSTGLLVWHGVDEKRPWQVAAAVGAMTVLAISLHQANSKWKRREEMRTRGLIDAQLPRFSVARWVFCPIETPGALRYAVKHSISEPDRALEAYRTHRTAVKQAKADHEQGEADRKSEEKQTAGLGPVAETERPQQTAPDPERQTVSDQTAESEPPAEPVQHRIPTKRPARTTAEPKRRAAARAPRTAPAADNVRTRDAHRYADEITAVRQEMERRGETGIPSYDLVQHAVKTMTPGGTCGREKAKQVRLQMIAQLDQERDAALAN